MEALVRVNAGHQPAYGDDEITRRFDALVERHFGREARGYPVWGGTGANVIGLAGLLRPYEAVICTDTAHIHTDECGALERFHGGKLLPVPTPDGKLTPDDVAARITGVGDEHRPQPKVISISQTSELGTRYSAGEMRALADLAHAHGLYLHLDGARLANAAAGLGGELRDATVDAGVDVFSLGGTKNGAMGAEAVLVARDGIADDLRFVRKQGAQLASKMRYVSAQLVALLSDDLWRRNAEHANAMARRLAEGVRQIPGLRIDYPVEGNAIFATFTELPTERVGKLAETWDFHVWDEEHNQSRWMTSFDTTPEDVDAFLADIRTVAGVR